MLIQPPWTRAYDVRRQNKLTLNTVPPAGSWEANRGWLSGNLTFLLQSQLPLGLDVLQRCSQVPGQAARAADRQQGALRGEDDTAVGSDHGRRRARPPEPLPVPWSCGPAWPRPAAGETPSPTGTDGEVDPSRCPASSEIPAGGKRSKVRRRTHQR